MSIHDKEERFLPYWVKPGVMIVIAKSKVLHVHAPMISAEGNVIESQFGMTPVPENPAIVVRVNSGIDGYADVFFGEFIGRIYANTFVWAEITEAKKENDIVDDGT